MRLRSAVSIFTLIAFLMFACVVWAQSPTTGQITGVVRDASGALVGGAKITLTNSSGVQRESTSDSGGRYTFSLLPPGNYRVEAEKTGFSTATAENVVVQITQTTTLDIPLVVASQKAVVEVAAESPLVDTENPARGSVIDQQQIRQLPLPTRNFQQLLTLTPGTSGPIQNSSELGRGADSRDEFIVQTSQYDASQGRVAGGIIAAVTKSGTNSFHGNLYEFFRND